MPRFRVAGVSPLDRFVEADECDIFADAGLAVFKNRVPNQGVTARRTVATVRISERTFICDVAVEKESDQGQ